jgi:hypothetical protein
MDLFLDEPETTIASFIFSRPEEVSIVKLFNEFINKDEDILFETKDDLNKFLYLLSGEEDVAGICIMSVDEYNSISEGIFSKTELLGAIEANSHCIENMDFKPKRGLFGKIFN